MNIPKIKVALIVVLTVGVVNVQAYGQTAEAADEWQIYSMPYFWLPSLDAKTTVAGASVNLDLSLGDILDNFDVIGFSGRIEAWRGDWGIFFDGMYTALDGQFKISTPTPTINVDVDIVETILDIGMGYKLFEMPLGENTNRMLTFEPLAGVRYHYLKQEITLSIVHPVLGAKGKTLGGNEEWVEPIVGARVKFDLTDNLAAGVRGDVGGFGIGSASNLTWNIVAGIDWQFKENMSLKLGYRIMDIDYERHSGSEKFGFDGQLSGPIIGMIILF